jgi:hypothetical protein
MKTSEAVGPDQPPSLFRPVYTSVDLRELLMKFQAEFREPLSHFGAQPLDLGM